MPPLALCAILLAAVTHATWNMAAKRAAHSRHFVWMYSLGSLLLWGPAVVWILLETELTFGFWQCVALMGTACFHLGYSLALQAGYRAADLSVVYPVARGSGPVLSFIGGALLLHEAPGPFAVMGLLLVVVGIVLVTGLLHKHLLTYRTGLYWGLIIGVFIAGYTLNDGWAVKVLLIHPLLIEYTGNLFRVLVLTPRTIKHRAELMPEFKQYFKPALTVSVLGPVGYVLVLYAMKIAPISHVAPARELSTLVGMYFGARLLKEDVTVERVLGAVCIVGGVLSLTLAG
jgi:drug/metabolite transporter (DMT)-like permease